MWLYAMTIVMGAGVAIMQVTMPPAVRAWVPNRIGFATAVYTNGLLVGEILPVVLMFPLVLPLAGGSWQWSFVIWSVPVAIIAVIVLMFAPTSGNRSSGAAATLVARLAQTRSSGGSALCSAPSTPRILPPTLSFPTI